MPIFLELLFLGILALLYWFFVFRGIKRERAERKDPFTRTLLKSPGESCLRKLDELADKHWEWHTLIFVGFGMLVGLVLGLYLPKLKSLPMVVLVAVASLSGAIYLMGRIRKNLSESANYRLGFEGERHSAQALQPLLAEGYELFHDLEFKDPNGRGFNLDHVLLGPSGVIVVETKARSKDAAGKGKEAASVRYDGEKILFPKGKETLALDQVLSNARFLSRELTARTGEKVYVRAAVSLPGWFVHQTAKEVNPTVLNAEMLRGWVLGLPAVSMETSQKNRIRSFLTRQG